MRINVRGAVKILAFSNLIGSALFTIVSLARLIERLQRDGEADQFEELLEMVEDTKSDAYRCAYELDRIFDRIFGK